MRLRATALVLALGGCGPQDERLPLPPVEWEGAHLRVGASVGVSELCAGTLAYADQYYGALKDTFGVDAREVSTVYWLPDGVEGYPACAPGYEFQGCARPDGTSFSEVFPSEHELVHAARANSGWAQRMLEEGAATHWGDDVVLHYAQMDVHDVFDSVSKEQLLDAADYGTAAHFVSYLGVTYGQGSLLELLDAAGYGSSEAEVDKAMRNTLGVAFVEATSDYEGDYPWCSPFIARNAEISCDIADPIMCQTVHTGGDPGYDLVLPYVEGDLACESEGVLGPKHDEVWRSYVFEIPAAGMYSLEAFPLPASAEPDDYGPWGYIMVERCGFGCGRFAIEMGSKRGALEKHYLEAGLYRVRMARRLDAPDKSVTGFAFAIQGISGETRDALCVQ